MQVIPPIARKLTLYGILALLSWPCAKVKAQDEPSPAKSENQETPITQFGAVGDGKTLNTEAIQKAIDQVSEKGGGTILVPEGMFLSGAIFLKPGVNLHLAENSVLKGSTEVKDYPKTKTRIEGHFEEWLPALVNADKTDHLRITGPGTLDGSGQPFWDTFWARRKEDSKVTNLAVERPRLVFIENSEDVQLNGLTLKDSGFWNLHLYRCHDVTLENLRIEVPKGAKAPSTDGTDVDSCQRVTIRGCVYSVNDDCICLKGSKGPFAMEDKDSPPVEHIRVSDCTFEAGGGVVTLGSEATVVRDVVVENCKVTGHVPVVRLKLRPDTPQLYEDIHYRNITLDNSTGGVLIEVKPWKQFFDLQGQPPPKSTVRNVTISDIKGTYGSFGAIVGNPDTEINGITLENIDVQLKNEHLEVGQVQNLTTKNVKVNGKEFSLKQDESSPSP